MATNLYHIENLDCANCAAKAEARINQLPGVQEATITFATMQLRLTAEDPDALLEQVLTAARQVEPDIRFLPREKKHTHAEHHHHHHEDCCCGEHHHHEGCDCEHHHAHDHDHDDHDHPPEQRSYGQKSRSLCRL